MLFRSLLQDNTVNCWGAGKFGELGNGQYYTNAPYGSALPVTVSGVSNATQISAGLTHSCALLQDNTIKCWGDGYYGQLGNGLDSSSTVEGERFGSSATPVTVIQIPDDGGSPITSYTATTVEDPSKSCTATAPFGLAEVPTCTITGLTTGQTYTFTVTATNAFGTSIPSAPSDPVLIP